MQSTPSTAPGPLSDPTRADDPTAGPLLTVIEPEQMAPIGRLGEWLFAQGASLSVVRPWNGEAIPAFEELGDGLVVMGGAMSAHDDEAHPWLAEVRALLRRAVDESMPALGICLGAQIAAEALGGQTAVPSPHGSESGVVDLHLTEAAQTDPIFSEIIAEGVRAAVLAGIPTQDGTVLPGIVSHDDGVVVLPAEAVLLASSASAPVQAWRAGKLLALQHHPESTPERVAFWQARNEARREGVVGSEEASAGMTDAELPEAALAAGERARKRAEEVDPVLQAFGRALARVVARNARAHRAARLR